MREIARRARPEDLPDPKENPHTHEVARGEHWPARVQYALYGLLFAGFGAFIVFLGLERWRRATFILGITMLYLAGLRQFLPDSLLGIMSVRSRNFDMWFNGCLGIGLVFLSVSVDALGS
ncbi:DUF3017 domain-containing protein [Corynebacterium sp. H113]|uniref:DUF3017 domain-containing protein n=1 Tax=Corynebacterium sp. H113 TaxID=3133419 RepID=UPI0030B5A6B7